MKRYLIMSLIMLFAACALYAQTANNATLTGPNSGSTVIVNTTKGLFVLRSGVLAKYDLATLKQDKEVELFGPMPAMPTDPSDNEARTKYFNELGKRRAPALLIPKDNVLLLVIGDGFARINQETLKTEATGDLTPAVKPADTTTGGPGGGMRNFMGQDAPAYLLTGDTLCLMRGTEILTLSATTGKVLQRSELPKELQPAQMGFNMGYNNRGNRGGNGGTGTRGTRGGATADGTAGAGGATATPAP